MVGLRLRGSVSPGKGGVGLALALEESEWFEPSEEFGVELF